MKFGEEEREAEKKESLETAKFMPKMDEIWRISCRNAGSVR
jgi:hypothetical protein